MPSDNYNELVTWLRYAVPQLANFPTTTLVSADTPKIVDTWLTLVKKLVAVSVLATVLTLGAFGLQPL